MKVIVRNSGRIKPNGTYERKKSINKNVSNKETMISYMRTMNWKKKDEHENINMQHS